MRRQPRLGCHKGRNLHDLGWRQSQKEAWRFGDGQSHTQSVLPGWPIEGTGWTVCVWPRLSLAKASNQSNKLKKRWNFRLIAEVLGWVSIKQSWIQMLQNIPRIQSLISLLHLFLPSALFVVSLSPLLFIVSEAFSIRFFPRKRKIEFERLRLTW